MRTRTSSSTRFNLKFLCVFSKRKRHPGKLHFTFFSKLKKLVRLFILKEVKPSPDSKLIKLLTLDYLFRHYDILPQTRSIMTTAIAFSRLRKPSRPRLRI